MSQCFCLKKTEINTLNEQRIKNEALISVLFFQNTQAALSEFKNRLSCLHSPVLSVQ